MGWGGLRQISQDVLSQSRHVQKRREWCTHQASWYKHRLRDDGQERLIDVEDGLVRRVLRYDENFRHRTLNMMMTTRRESVKRKKQCSSFPARSMAWCLAVQKARRCNIAPRFQSSKALVENQRPRLSAQETTSTRPDSCVPTEMRTRGTGYMVVPARVW